jgi:hypothetical protein
MSLQTIALMSYLMSYRMIGPMSHQTIYRR